MASAQDASRPAVDPSALARTYSNRAYDDPWQAVEDYREVMAYAEANPEEGYYAIASTFDFPRGRVESWLDGRQPHSVRGIETAQSRGWVDVDPTSGTFRGLNVLVAWILQAGSITRDTWVPFFTVGDDRDRALLESAAERIGLSVDITRATGAHRSYEMRPVEHGSVLGRVLVVLGAPRGESRSAGEVTVPDYLEGAPRRPREEFVQLYLHHLGRVEDGRTFIHLPSYQSDEYVAAVAELIRRLTDEPVQTVQQHVVLSEAASREIAVWDPLLEVE